MIWCRYCGEPLDLNRPETWRTTRGHGVACADVDACDRRDDDRHRRVVSDLRRRKREGDDLTEAEAETLREGS